MGAMAGVVANRAYSSVVWRALTQAAGSEPSFPSQPAHPAVSCDQVEFRRRDRVENLSAALKEWRALATRYDKTAAGFLGGLHRYIEITGTMYIFADFRRG